MNNQLKINKLRALGYIIRGYNDWAILCEDEDSRSLYLNSTNEFIEIKNDDCYVAEHFITYTDIILDKRNIRTRVMNVITRNSKNTSDEFSENPHIYVRPHSKIVVMQIRPISKIANTNKLIIFNVYGESIEITLDITEELGSVIESITENGYKTYKIATRSMFSNKYLRCMLVDEDFKRKI